MKAYDIIFLEEAQLLLAEYFETSVNDLGIALEKAWKSFALSKYSQNISCGYPFETLGKSGSEIAFDLHCVPRQQPSFSQTKSIEFQLGSLIAYYQWYRDVPLHFYLSKN